MKNTAKQARESKENESKPQPNQTSFLSSSVNKRASSAKSRKERKEKERRVVYERVPSKKSLKNEEYGRNNQEGETSEVFLDNPSIFQNKNLQQLILKQRQSEPLELDDDCSQDFN
jgi:hypothetical protein